MQKKVSVIIPCYNAQNYLTECLDSLIRQTIGLNALEIIVVDDASTDDSALIVQRYVDKYPESIQSITLIENQGQANARNIGFEIANGQYVTFVDADDWVSDNIYEKMLEPVNEYPFDWIHCAFVSHLENQQEERDTDVKAQKIFIEDIDARKKFLQNKYVKRVIGTSLFRTEWIRGNNLRFQHFEKYEDNYWGGIIKFYVTSFCSITDGLYHYRILDKSNCHSRNDTGHFARLNVELEKLKFYIENNLFETYYEEIRDNFIVLFYINTLHIICCQFDYFPLEQVEMMQSIVKEMFPDYLEFCKKSTDFVNSALTIAFDFPIEVWKDYQKAYYDWLSGGKADAIAKFYVMMRNVLGITLEGRKDQSGS